MMDGLAAAILAGGMANVAGINSKLATDGAQIGTDEEGEGAIGAVGAFSEVFAKVTEQVPEATVCAELKLPELPVISPVTEEESVFAAELQNEELPEEPVEMVLDAPNLPMPVQPVIVDAPVEVESNSEALPPAELKVVESVEVQEENVAPVVEDQPEVKAEFSLPQPQVVSKDVEVSVKAPAMAVLPERRFVEVNHPTIVSEIRGRLLPDGGSMHIRLDPPELGALAVRIDVRDGFVTASFQTSNDEATRLLGHSLGQLRQTLESQGVSVEKLHVQQTPREQFTSNSNSHDRERAPGQQADERSAQDDQQRREMLQRMWRRLAVGRDMLDLVA